MSKKLFYLTFVLLACVGLAVHYLCVTFLDIVPDVWCVTLAQLAVNIMASVAIASNLEENDFY